jgi:hypothetical protein
MMVNKEGPHYSKDDVDNIHGQWFCRVGGW